MSSSAHRSTGAASVRSLWTGAVVIALAWFAVVTGLALTAAPLSTMMTCGFAALALAPLIPLSAAVLLLAESRRLAVEARRIQALADDMLAPSMAGAGAAGAIVADIRAEVEHLERRVADAVRQVSQASERLRLAAESDAADARRRYDELGEAAFAAGRTANQVFEARIADADALVRRSSEMVDEVALQGASRLASAAERARDATAELDALLVELDRRVAQLPPALAAQTEQVRSAVAAGLTALAAEARRTAEQAALADEALQARVRRNFDMLNETVKLMGLMAAAAPAIQPPASADPEAVEITPETERPRLRLELTERDRALASVFSGPPSAPEPEITDTEETAAPEDPAETWTWSDLLASLGDGPGRADGPFRDEASAALEDAFAALGLDLMAPPSAAQVGEALGPARDLAGLRELTRRSAAAQIRRIERRLQTDGGLRAQVEPFLTRGRARLAMALAAGEADLVAYLATRDGRLLLMADAAMETIT